MVSQKKLIFFTILILTVLSFFVKVNVVTL